MSERRGWQVTKSPTLNPPLSPWCYLEPCTLPLYEIEGLNLVALDSDDDGPGSWGSCDGPDSWEVMHNRFFGLQNVE